MKKTLLLLAVTFTFAQIQAQTTKDLFEVGTSVFGTSKKQKKKDKEKSIIDSTNTAIATNKKKREIFIKDSILNVESANRQNEKIKLDKKKHEWYFDHYNENPYSFTFNKTIVGYYIVENPDSPTVAMDIFSDNLTITKIGSLKLINIPPTEIFNVLAYNSYNKCYLIKSTKDNKICVINEDVKSYQNWGKGNGATLTSEYVDPQLITQKKILLDNYRAKLNGALSTVEKLEAIHSKHMYKRTNQFGVVIEEGYKKDEFTAQEKAIYKQLILKLEKQKDSLDADLTKKIGNKETVRGLLNFTDISKQSQVEHAYTNYSYYTLEW